MDHIQKKLNILGNANTDTQAFYGASAGSNKTNGLVNHDPGSDEVEELNFVPQNGFPEASSLKALNRSMPIIQNAVDPMVVEHYRKLRTKILQCQATKSARTLVTTSPSPQDGKTLTVLNLGLSFGMLPNFKVLLVDGDLRRGSLGKSLGVDKRLGFSNFIDGSARFEDVLTKSDRFPFYFIGSGTSEVPAAELLQSYELKSKFAGFAKHFSVVLVDSPPANLITDVQLLAAHCDAVLLIARAYATTRKAFEKTVQDLSSFRIIGTVLNGGTRIPLYRRYQEYY